jgi:hypothetical protein
MDFFRRLSRALVSLGVAVASASIVLFAASPADGATLKLNRAGITRKAPFRTDPVSRYWINRSECVSGDEITFPMILTDYGGTELEIWVGEGTGDCTSREARTTTNATCWRIYKGIQGTNVPSVTIKVQDIAAKKKPPVHDLSIGGPEDCNATTTAAQSITLYFMLIASLDNQGGESWNTSLDLAGPNAPAGLSVGVGSTLLKANWLQNSDTDVASYRFFCDPPPGVMADADHTFGPGPRVEASIPIVPICPDASADVDDAEAPDADPACTDGGGGTGGSGGSGGTSTGCGTTVLARDLIPDPDFAAKYACGSGAAKASTSAIITDLINGQPTNVAIAAIDAAGNAGPLSDIVCGVPEPVDGFDEVYRRAGGSAGDGFCAISSYPGKREGMLLASLELLALVALIRRRSTAPDV